tara:strand:+ start:14 stop:178 length:165 start_codon:yes stop_codon:yes gene_type:complete
VLDPSIFTISVVAIAEFENNKIVVTTVKINLVISFISKSSYGFVRLKMEILNNR